MKKYLKDGLKRGDRVTVSSDVGFASGGDDTVVRVTKRHIILTDNDKYWRKNGRSVSHPNYHIL